ncbi:hypothetical protein GF326_02040, partial [Candidatus Bathyarchaeota archaeon]|nr:hypothetical protein [Candidatus Bathyarchaeota archaeon]
MKNRDMAVKALNNLIHDAPPEERRRVIKAMMALGYPEYADSLIPFLYHDSPIRYLAVNAFTLLATPEHASHILCLLDDPDPMIAQLALTAIQHTPTESSVPRLRRLLTHMDDALRS